MSHHVYMSHVYMSHVYMSTCIHVYRYMYLGTGTWGQVYVPGDTMGGSAAGHHGRERPAVDAAFLDIP